MKIRLKLILMFLVVGLVSTITIGVLAIDRAEKSLNEEIRNRLLGLAEAKEGFFFIYIDSIEGRIIDFASDGFIREKTKEIVSASSIKPVDDLNQHLTKNKKSLDENIAGIDIVDLNGIIIASTHPEKIGDDESKDTYFIEGKKGIFSSVLELHEHFGLMDALVESAPLTDIITGEVLGVIIVVFDLDKIQSVLSGKFQIEKGAPTGLLGFSETLEVYTVGKEKKMFVHPISHMDETEIIVDTLPVQKCFENGEEIIDVYTNYAGKEVIGASMCNRKKGFVLLSEIQSEEAFAPVNSLRFEVFLITLGIFLAIFFIAIFFSKTFTLPIKKLHKGTEIIGAGNLDYKINIKTKDEIGQLSRAFDKMTFDLKESRGELEEYGKKLEKEVGKKTKELNKTISELKDSRTAALNIMEDMQVTMNKMKTLEELDRLKTHFLNVTSHELKTPITPIKSQIQLLLDGYFGNLNEKQKESMEMILRNTTRLNNLISDILDISRIESKTLKLYMSKVSIEEAVKESVESMIEYAKKNGIAITTNIGKLSTIEADRDRIIQVINNIVFNAVKFTPKGGRVDVKAQQKENSIMISIKDTGIGIAKENLNKLFQPFFQIETTDFRKYGGSGLGLAISKGIVEQHKGAIWVESPGIGKGSTFNFTLPLKQKK